MNKAPAFLLFPSKALAGTDHLSEESFKAYWKVIWWMWDHGQGQCKMPDTDGAWQLATGITTKKKLQRIREEIMQPEFKLFRKNKQKMLYSNGLKKAKDTTKKRSKAGEIGANSRWGNDLQGMRPHGKRIAKARKPQCITTTDTITTTGGRESEAFVNELHKQLEAVKELMADSNEKLYSARSAENKTLERALEDDIKQYRELKQSLLKKIAFHGKGQK